jgi:hypothetical protein
VPPFDFLRRIGVRFGGEEGVEAAPERRAG